MALFMKQDFSPPVLSRKWIAMKFRPNMLIYSREHIITILESGLLFREDSVEVEQEAPSPGVAWSRASGTTGGWLTRGERNITIVALAGLLYVSPPRDLHRWSLLKASAYGLVAAAVRACQRARCGGALAALLRLMADYTALARRAAACCRDHAAVGLTLESVTSAVSSMQSLLCRQQAELSSLMSRATSALLGSAPWLRGDVPRPGGDTLVKIHHGFLVVQSTFLKYVALAHFIPSLHSFKMYRNHNERIYWIHNTLIHHILQEFKENYETLERMYRLLKNYGTKDSESAVKKPGSVINSWLYSDVHTGVARSCMEMKIALDKATHLDMFLDSCALNNQDLDLDVLDRDIDEIIDDITKCLNTVQNSQIRLKKMQNKLLVGEESKEDEEFEENLIFKIEDKEPEVRDEVFYFVKTEEERAISPTADILTGPGKIEKENSKIVLKELKRKLVKREDLMRERERQALAKTMPELKNVPEFPRQIKYEELIDKKGYITKLHRSEGKRNLHEIHRIRKQNHKVINYKLQINKIDLSKIIHNSDFLLKCDDNEFTIKRKRNKYFLLKHRSIRKDKDSSSASSLSNTLSGGETSNRKENLVNNYKFEREDLESASSDSDFENIYNNKMALLNDVRRHRAMRKKNFPAKRASIDIEDEGLKPIEYSFGTGMAMASMLQINNKMRANMLQEEVFIGDGEVSNDSGNDEDT